MSTETLQCNEAGLDQWTDSVRFEVERDRLIQYAVATNDPIAAHRAGDVAAPVFAIVPVFEALLEPALAVVPLSVLGRVLHGEQEFRFHRPIRPGDVLVSRGKMTGFEGLPNGTRCCTYLETRDEDGDLLVEQYVTSFVRGFDDGRRIGELSPAHKLDESLREAATAAEFTQHVDEDQTLRYSPASGDPMPIHLDEQVARDVGLPGIIAHGFCMLAFASWGILDELGGGDVSRLKRLAVRFSKPVLPGQDIHTRVWETGPGVYAFETDVDGTAVLRDGLAEVA
ncbi:MAG TPA: MaoC/PaaZ C-terminal domain-containing protein [Solirubrobacteraceae bacterium]